MNFFRPLFLTCLKCGLLHLALCWLCAFRLLTPIPWGLGDIALLLLVFLGGCASGACWLLEAVQYGERRASQPEYRHPWEEDPDAWRK